MSSDTATLFITKTKYSQKSPTAFNLGNVSFCSKLECCDKEEERIIFFTGAWGAVSWD